MAQRFDMQGFANAWNTQQIDRIVEFYADDAEIRVLPDTEPYRGKDGVRENVQEVFRGIGDINGDMEWSVQEGNKVAMLVNVTGKHTGPMTVSEEQVIPASDRNLRFKLALFLELDENGKIKRETDIADNLTLLEQVGAMPIPQGGEQRGAGVTAGTQQTRRTR